MESITVIGRTRTAEQLQATHLTGEGAEQALVARRFGSLIVVVSRSTAPHASQSPENMQASVGIACTEQTIRGGSPSSPGVVNSGLQPHTFVGCSDSSMELITSVVR